MTRDFLVVSIWGSSTVWPLSLQTTFFHTPVIILLAAGCDCCLSRFHCVPLRKAWPCLLYKFPLEPWRQQLDLFSLSFSRLNNLSSLHLSQLQPPKLDTLPLFSLLRHMAPSCKVSYSSALLPERAICWAPLTCQTDRKPAYPILTFLFVSHSTSYVTGFLLSWSLWQNFLPAGSFNSSPWTRIHRD